MNNLVHKILVLLALFPLLILTATGQKIIHPEPASFRGQFINYKSSAPGVDMSSTCLYFDRKGFLWSGTVWELYRFDGLEYKVFHANISDSTGLAGNYITDICEDDSGKIWVSTLGALNCLDQKTWTFRHFIPDTSDFLSASNMIYYLYEDSRQLVWLVTGADIYTFNRLSEEFKRYRIDSLSYLYERIPLNRTGRILEDRAGRIWIATGYGLYRYDQSTDSLVAFRNIENDTLSLSNNYITNIKEDRTGVLWCTTLGGLHKISDPEKGVFKKPDLNIENNDKTIFDSSYVLLPDSKGNIWVFGSGTVSCHNPASGKTGNYIITFPDYFIGRGREIYEWGYQYAFEDRNGGIWFLFAFCGLLYHMDPATGKTVLYQVPNYAVLSCIMDRTGSFWFGCVINNIWMLTLDKLPYSFIRLEENSPSLYVEKADVVSESGNQIFLTLSSGVYTTEKIKMSEEFRLKPFHFPDGTRNGTSVYVDKSENIWFGREPGKISVIKNPSSSFYDYRLPSDKTGPVRKIFEDDKGNLWMKTLFAIFKMNAGESVIEQFISGNKELDISITRGITDICVDREGKVWIAPIYGKGIFRFDSNNNKVSFFGQDSGLDIRYADYCTRIIEDFEGCIWLLFSWNGLFQFDREKDRFNRIPLNTDPGIRLDFLDCYVDNNERIVISHNNGFIIYNKLTKESKTIRFPQPVQFCHFYYPENGDLFYITGDRMVVFPDTLPEKNAPPEVYITSLQINSEDYNSQHPEAVEAAFLEKINLAHYQNNIRISFTALNFIDADLCRYGYFMNGIDIDTLTVSAGEKYAEYKKVRPGKYVFWVSASNKDEIWNREGKTIEIRILHPWYTSLIAILTYMALFICLIAVFVNLRLRQLRTEKAALESIVRVRTAELEEKNRQIEKMDMIKTNFFTEISHEIRTPLSLIVGPIDNVINELDGSGKERALKWLDVMKRNGNRLLSLVNQILDISKLDSGKMKLTLVEADIFKCIRIIACGFLSLAETRKIRFIVKVPDVTYKELFDSDKIEKIVTNLLANAFKFTPAGGSVSLSVNITPPFEKQLSPLLYIIVKDSGSGISKEHMVRIFDRFYRAEGQWDKDEGGSGVGLALVSEFVNLMHGKIDVESESGCGSKFSISLPLGKKHLNNEEYILIGTENKDEHEFAEITYIDSGINDRKEEQNTSKYRVLVIEDNFDLREFIRESLHNNYTVYETENGISGRETAYSTIPDIIVTDLILPDMNGVDLCKILKNDERTSHIPVIMLTAKTTINDKIEGLEAGADDYLFKPFNIKELKIRISNLLLQRERLRLKFGLLTGFEQPDNLSDTTDDKFMKKITGIITENISDFEFNVGVLQEKIGMSRVHLYRKLKALTGLSPGDLIRNHRMKQAAYLIKQRTKSLTEISLSIGFSNPSYFSKCFKEYYGVSPKDYNSSSNQ